MKSIRKYIPLVATDLCGGGLCPVCAVSFLIVVISAGLLSHAGSAVSLF